jgi:ribosomal-protein-alanine N-acetyltransferase
MTSAITTTNRLELRPFSPQSLLALVESEAAFERVFGLPPAPGLRGFFASGEIAPQWFEMLRQATAADPWTFGFAVIDRASGSVIGSAGFKGAPREGMVEVAYGLVPSFEGKGCATEALRQLIGFAVQDGRVKLLRAHTLPARNASTRVLQKNGFLHQGEVIDPDDGPVWRWERPAHRDVKGPV